MPVALSWNTREYMVKLNVEKRIKQVKKTCNINQLFGEEYGQELYIDNRMGCRDGDAVCIDIGETRGDGVWEKRISVETGVGGCDILTVDYMVWI